MVRVVRVQDGGSVLQAVCWHGHAGGRVCCVNRLMKRVCPGGWDGRSVLQSVERLDVSIGRFVRVADMNVARASPALAVLDGFLYAIGGFDGNDWLREVSLHAFLHARMLCVGL